eukprot:COSAG02_NODE_2511_length_8625_cov_8.283955_4_plen_74_part_00
MLVCPERLADNAALPSDLTGAMFGLTGGIVDQQLIAIVRKFDRDGSGMLVIDRFVEAVCGTAADDSDYGSAPY